MPFSLLKEHTASLRAVFPCVAVACCPSQPPTVFVYISVCTEMDNEENTSCHLGFHRVLPPLSGCLFIPPPSIHEMLINWPGTSFWLWGEKKALTPTTKHGSWTGLQKKNEIKKKDKKEKNCLFRASGEEVGNTYAHPWILPGRRHDDHSLLLRQWAMLVKMKVFIGMFVWKGRDSRRWDESNPRATILELLTVVFNNIRSILVLEERKITNFCV